MDKYYFFWDGECSNWYKSNFEIGGIWYNCVEQYMMAEKARAMGDVESCKAIMNSTNPRDQKAMGRKVKNYDDKIWGQIRYQVVVDGCRAKFTQDESLKEFLIKTGEKIIVEASPYDKIWGIGLSETHPDRLDESKWQGENLLGKAIMEVRAELMVDAD